jgi:hypothetical protein
LAPTAPNFNYQKFESFGSIQDNPFTMTKIPSFTNQQRTRHHWSFVYNREDHRTYFDLQKQNSDNDQTFDLVYLHADVLVKKDSEGQQVGLDFSETLSTDRMYREITNKLKEHNKNLKVAKLPLTQESLFDCVGMKP